MFCRSNEKHAEGQEEGDDRECRTAYGGPKRELRIPIAQAH